MTQVPTEKPHGDWQRSDEAKQADKRWLNHIRARSSSPAIGVGRGGLDSARPSHGGRAEAGFQAVGRPAHTKLLS